MTTSFSPKDLISSCHSNVFFLNLEYLIKLLAFQFHLSARCEFFSNDLKNIFLSSCESSNSQYCAQNTIATEKFNKQEKCENIQNIFIMFKTILIKVYFGILSVSLSIRVVLILIKIIFITSCSQLGVFVKLRSKTFTLSITEISFYVWRCLKCFSRIMLRKEKLIVPEFPSLFLPKTTQNDDFPS